MILLTGNTLTMPNFADIKISPILKAESVRALGSHQMLKVTDTVKGKLF